MHFEVEASNKLFIEVISVTLNPMEEQTTSAHEEAYKMYRRASCKVNSAAMAAFVAGERALHEQSPAAAGGWRGGYKRLEDANKSTRSLRASFIERSRPVRLWRRRNRHTDKEEEEHEEEEVRKAVFAPCPSRAHGFLRLNTLTKETPVKGGKSKPVRRRMAVLPKAGPLQNVDLRLGQGRIYAVVGSHGSGKSALLRLISKAMHPSGGEVFIPPHLSIVHVEQQPQIVKHMSLYENLTLGYKQGKKRPEVEHVISLPKPWAI